MFFRFLSYLFLNMISEGVECRQNVVMGPWNDILCSKSMLFQDGTIGKILEKRDLLEAKMAPKNQIAEDPTTF